MEEHLPSRPGHETRDAGVRPIVLTGVGLAVMIVIVGLIVYGTFQYLARHPATSPQANPMAAGDPRFHPSPASKSIRR